jgi:hypothetical protein
MYRYMNPLHFDARQINRRDDDTYDILFTIILSTISILFLLSMNDTPLTAHPPMYKIYNHTMNKYTADDFNPHSR